jgi:hypothetical protein
MSIAGSSQSLPTLDLRLFESGELERARFLRDLRARR